LSCGARPGRAPRLIFEASALRLNLKPRGAVPSPTVTLGIRPEHVRLTADSDGRGATVSLTEPLGDETLVFLDYGGPSSLVAKVNAEDKLAVGDRRGFTFRGDRIVFFDTAAGDRILR
jgi:multiple sugar transport system ATP-binding protein